MGTRQDRELESGEEFVVGQWRLVPKARVTRRRLRLAGPSAGAVFARVTPVSLDVSTPGGDHKTVAVRQVSGRALAAMVGVAVVTPLVAVCLLAAVRLAARRARQR